MQRVYLSFAVPVRSPSCRCRPQAFGVRRQADTPGLWENRSDRVIAPDYRGRHGPDAALDWDRPKAKAPSLRCLGNTAPPPVPDKHRSSNAYRLGLTQTAALCRRTPKGRGQGTRPTRLAYRPKDYFSRNYHSGALFGTFSSNLLPWIIATMLIV